MAIMSSVKLSAQIKSIKGNSSKLREQIQEALISCAYYTVKDGNTNPFNQLLDAVGTSTRIKGITMWAELYGFVRVVNEKFVLNKSARREADVTDEESFAQYEETMRASPKWFELAPKEKAESIFDPSTYLSGVLTKLEKEGHGAIVPYLEDAVAAYNRTQAIKELAATDVSE